MTARPLHDATDDWRQQPERSNMFWLRVMSWLSLHLGRRVSRLVLHPIAAYFLLFAADARRASRDYLHRALGRPARLGDVYRHFHSFASAIHDRVYLLNERFDLFDIAIEGREHIEATIGEGKGVFLMGAHVGSFEVIRAIGRAQPGLHVAMVMYEENARKINAALSAISPRATQDIIPLGTLDAMLRVRDALDGGSLVGILGDRGLASESTTTVPLLGDPAQLPVGPWRMAAMLRRPVLLMAGLYEGGNRYRIRFMPLADFSEVTAAERSAAIENAIGVYARAIEALCRAAPYNWFNFFDVWASARTPEASPDA